MSNPTPAWRIYTEQGASLVLEVDVAPGQHIYVTVTRVEFGTPEMDSLITHAVDGWRDAHTTARTPDDSTPPWSPGMHG